MKATYHTRVTELLIALATGARPLDLATVAADLLTVGALGADARTRARRSPGADTASTNLDALTGAELFAHFKHTAVLDDARFALRAIVDLPADLRARWQRHVDAIAAGAYRTPKDAHTATRALLSTWRRQREAFELETGAQCINKPEPDTQPTIVDPTIVDDLASLTAFVGAADVTETAVA